MAERRMFAKTIIDSDAFLDMPLSTQALYFHLSMRADDEGFVNNPKKIARMIGADDDSLKLLIMKNFIIPFESGIVVIKHWKIHNYIRSDRFKDTSYQEEKSQLEVAKNGEYAICQPLGIPDVNRNGYQMDTQDRLGKDRLGKDRLILSADEPQEKRDDSQAIQSVVDSYHEICVSLPRVRVVTDKRKSAIKARLKKYSVEQIREAFEKAEQSDFLTGKVKEFTASFDWILNETNLVKIIEGNYDNKTVKPKPKEDDFYAGLDDDKIF